LLENDWYPVVPSSSLVTSSVERGRESKGNLDYLVTFGVERESKGERLVPSCTLFYFCNLGWREREWRRTIVTHLYFGNSRLQKYSVLSSSTSGVERESKSNFKA
ncbi:Hypothetical protein BRZCDTV_99, partial [Brazilian cedratvirus IHUMI]